MTSTMSDRNEERRRRVLLGPLPTGFLRADGTTDTIDTDYEAALALQQQLSGATMPTAGTPLTARLSITIAQAKLSKNYAMADIHFKSLPQECSCAAFTKLHKKKRENISPMQVAPQGSVIETDCLTRMDPYVRVRVGHCIYETHTDPSGGRTPRWNKVIHCLLPPGVNSIYLEIFDECSFTMDELIAWTHINIPPAVLQGETYDDWFPLNGKQGDGKEGQINLVLSYSVGPASVATFPPMLVVPSTGMGYAAMPVYAAPPPHVAPHLPPHLPPPPQQAPVTPEQLQQIEEMFPSMDKEVIRSVLEANRGNKDATINSLLQMSE